MSAREDGDGQLMKSVGITTDCVCDLPEGYLRKQGVDLIYFYVVTDSGRFRDGHEITSGNILEYLEEGGEKAETHAPDPQDYRAFFEKNLERFDEIVHIGISSHVGQSHQNAKAALALMGDAGRRVTLVDSEHFSTAMGHLLMKAVELRDSGSTAAQIAETVAGMRSKVVASFISKSADYLDHNGQIDPRIGKWCSLLNLHPVIRVKNGRISLQMVRIGTYERCVMRYIRGALRHSGQIDNRRLFITHAGCTIKMLSQIKAEAERLCKFDEIIVTQASATVSGNFGPGMVGVVLIRK